MKGFICFTIGILLFGSVVFSAKAAFTNLYVFGDSISSTTDNPAPLGPYYYGKRYSNGRVWVEVLAQRQGLTLYSTNNNSYFGNTSTSIIASVANFTAPLGVNMSNILFVIWVNNADLFYPAQNNGTDLHAWTNAMNVSLTNHFKAITNLYAKGARILVLPNVVDLSTIPQFNTSANTNFVHQRCIDYNVAFAATLNRVRTNFTLYPGLTIYIPDFFTLLTNILAYPASYSVTNALSAKGHSVDVIDSSLSDTTTNGPGTNYIFWDPQDPTAKVHMWMGNLAQQLISPVQISNITMDDDEESIRLDMANVPVGQNGLVLGRTNLILGRWTTNTLSNNTNVFNSTNTTQSVFVPSSGPVRFYRLNFPYSWTWP